MKTSKHAGFTLVEVLICIILLTIVISGGIALYFNSSHAMGLAMRKKIAMEMATQFMEQTKNSGYAALPSPASGNWETATTVTFGDFSAQRQRRVTDIAPGGANANKKIEMKLTWTDPGKQTSGEIDLATYISPP